MALLANQIWQCLDLDLLDGSEVLAEQLVANDDTPDTKYLLAYVQYRRGQFESAKLTCKPHLNHAGCAWVFAQSCLKLEQGPEGIKALECTRKTWDLGNDMPLQVGLGRGELSPAAFHLLYAKLQALTDSESAISEYTSSVRLNPYLVENVMALCSSVQVKVKTASLFSRFEDPFVDSPTTDMHSPMNSLNGAHSGGATQLQNLHFTGDEPSLGPNLVHHNGPSADPPAASSMGPSMGPSLVPSLVPSLGPPSHTSLGPPIIPSQTVTSTPRRFETPHRILSTPMGPKGGPLQTGPTSHAAQTGHTGHLGQIFGPSPSFVAPPNRAASGGLFQTPTQGPQPNHVIPAGGGRRQQDRVLSLSFKKGDQTSISSLGRNLFASPQHATSLSEPKTGVEALETIAEALQLLSESEFQDAVAQLQTLAEPIRHTPFVLQLLGRLTLELAEYTDSVQYYEELRNIQPDRVNGIEFMSTALWHLKRDSNLSMLGYELTRKGTRIRHHWQSWCALGNAFSLRHDTQNAIKCFQRAATINPRSEYAYTLMGYEYASNDELENATQAFAKALKANPQHYNAWYGLGSVHYTLGQYTVAEMHFTQAIRLNPNNPVLLCFLGAVLETRGKFSQALAQFERACQLSPSSPMPRFRKAEALLEAGMYKDALKELLEIEKTAPEDPTIHFAIAKAHKGLGEGELAVQRFTGAQQLAPKMAMMIRRELEEM